MKSPTDYAIDADRNLYFTLEDGETPENSSLFINGYKGNLFEVKGNNITVSGLKFSGVYDGSAVSVTAEGCTVKNCLFEEIQNGTAVTAKGNKNKVLNCFFNRLGASCVTVDFCSGSRGLIRNGTAGGNIIILAEIRDGRRRTLSFPQI